MQTYALTGLLFLASSFLAGCAVFNRSVESGYASRTPKVVNAYSSTETPRPESDSTRTAYELGFDPNNMSGDELQQVQQRQQLRDLEKGLRSRQEKEQYSKVLPWLQTDEEKIAMLSIPSLEGRQNWINRNGVWGRARVPATRMKELIDSQDIAVGMPMEYVRRAWGDPLSIETSGNPVYRNERWRYTRNVPGSDGFHQQKRFVYFEGGRVVGWDTE
ncbi:hypothetical protein [Bdellovibrio sp. HCB337]|uniref:hypothetical protein n=1 Tax=Bdellovibrio sp. HCB337 TaxID=3394358 RepID=UPI0039A5065B